MFQWGGLAAAARPDHDHAHPLLARLVELHHLADLQRQRLELLLGEHLGVGVGVGLGVGVGSGLGAGLGLGVGAGSGLGAGVGVGLGPSPRRAPRARRPRAATP